MGRCYEWASKVADFFGDREEDLDPKESGDNTVVARVANSVMLMSMGREEDPERDFHVGRTPNWKLRVFHVVVGLIQLCTGNRAEL